MIKQLLYIPFFLLLFVHSGCSHVKPISPEIVVDNDWTIPDQTLSVVDIPIHIKLNPYFRETDSSIPKYFSGEESTCEGVSYSYNFIREPILLTCLKDQLQFDVRGKYALRLNYCPQCTELFNSEGNCIIPRIYTSCGVGEPMRAMQVVYTTKIGVTDNYKLTSKTTLQKVKALSPCQITVFEYNATETIEKEVTGALKALEKDIDKEIGSIDLKPDVLATWNLLQEPSDLDGFGYLYLNPHSIAISDVTYCGDTATVHASLEVKPQIFLHKPDIVVRPLPKAKNYVGKDGFRVAMDIEARYDSLNAILRTNLTGMKTELKGREVIFDEIRIFGALNHKISLEVKFSGKKKGILYLTGTPSFNAERQVLSFPDMEFDVETKSALLKSAKWLFDKKVCTMIRDAAQIDLKPYLDSTRTLVNESLNGELDDGVYMSGSVNEVSVQTIQPLSEHLFIRILSDGKLEIRM